ncbi:MAG: RNA polymerase sigma factor [Caldilineaceae bacterium]
MAATDPLWSDCQQVIATLLQRHDWQLLDATSFCDQLTVQARAQALSAPDALMKLAIHLYCQRWYTACRSPDQQRPRAYTELAHYLYNRALHQYGDGEVAQEITQEALLLVAQQLDQVQNPGAFLAFALLKLWNAATAYFRQRDRHARRIQPLPEPSAEEQPADLADPQAPQPETIIADNELERQVRQRIEALITVAPRARNQFQAVLLKFLEGYSDAEIATALETDVANVHVLRSRGLNRLRADGVLRQLFEDLVIS